MNWVDESRTWLGRAMVAAVLVTLAGCATTSKDPAEEAAQAKAQAEEQALKQAFGEAVSEMEANNRDAARQQFEALHQQHPERTGPLANLGILALAEGEKDAAREHFEQVVALNAQHAPALNHLGVIARENGEFEQAEDYYRQALAAQPDYLPAMMNLAILLDIYLGKPGEALPLYEQYQSMADDPNPRLKDWIFDAKNRI